MPRSDSSWCYQLVAFFFPLIMLWFFWFFMWWVIFCFILDIFMYSIVRLWALLFLASSPLFKFIVRAVSWACFTSHWVPPTILAKEGQQHTLSHYRQVRRGLAPSLALLILSWWKWGTNSHCLITYECGWRLGFLLGPVDTSKGRKWLTPLRCQKLGAEASLLNCSDTRKVDGRKPNANWP